jgi:nitrilase
VFRHCWQQGFVRTSLEASSVERGLMSKLRTIKAAAVQAEPVVLDREATVSKACQLISEAASNGAQLVVFPELFIPTFVNSSIWGRGLATWGSPKARNAWLRLWQNSVEIGDESTARLCQAAGECGVTLAMGLHERTPGTRTLYNTILFIGADGAILGKHRKLVPTNAERMVHGFGDGSTLKVFDTPVGKVGGLICWENWMPLARYALYAQGEQIHVVPTAFDDEMGIVNARNTAFEGGVFVISVCMILRKSSFPADFEFQEELAVMDEHLEAGGSCIIAPDGRILAGPLWKEEGILYADLDLNDTIRAGHAIDSVGHYARSEVLGLRFNTAAQKLVTMVE